MGLQEITNLIQLRNYISTAVNNMSTERKAMNELHNMLLLIDQKLVNTIISDNFKEELGIKDSGKAVSEIVKTNNAAFIEAAKIKGTWGDKAVVATPGDSKPAQEVKVK